MFGTTNTGFPGATNFTNVSLTFSLQSTPDFADYPYRATYTNSAVTSNAYASVTFSNIQATSGNFASICQTFDGGVYLYAKSNVGTVTIPTISVGFNQSGLNIDTTVTAGSQALITSGAVADAIDVKTGSKYQSMSIGSGTSNSTAELILPSDGKYLILARAWWTSNSTGSRYIGLLVNHQGQHWMDSRTAYDESYATFSIIWEDNAGTSLKALGYQNSGSALTMYVNMQYVKLG